MGDVALAEADRTAVQFHKAGDGAKERALAAARGPKEADELAVGDVEIDAFQHVQRAEALAEIFDTDRCQRIPPLSAATFGLLGRG